MKKSRTGDAAEIRTHESGITFAVDDVERIGYALNVCKVNESIQRFVESDIEACYSYRADCLADVDYHPLFQATELAYARHRPLVFSPDMIWIAIVQGVAQHVKNHSEKLRSRFVGHDGKQDICIERADFHPGSPENDWPGIIADFSKAVEENVGKASRIFVPQFSTTGAKERVAGQIAMMDAFQEYFRYLLMSICGIPEITLEGTVRDWERVRKGLDALGDYDLDWWISRLEPICDQFVEAARGNVNRQFWQRIFRTKEAYGTVEIDGWLTHLVPYVKDDENQFRRRNPCLFSQRESVYSGILPKGISQAPLTCCGEAGPIAYDLLGGFVGVTQDEVTLALRPEIGWAARRSKEIEQVIAALEEHATSRQVNGKGFAPCQVFESLSADFVRLYQEYDGAKIDYAKGWVRIRCEEAIERVYPEVPSDTDPRRQVYFSWVLFADLSDGSQIGVFVPLNHEAPQPIVRSMGVPTLDAPGEVIAQSIEEFLELSLDGTDMPYPLAPGFQHSGSPLEAE